MQTSVGESTFVEDMAEALKMVGESDMFLLLSVEEVCYFRSTGLELRQAVELAGSRWSSW